MKYDLTQEQFLTYIYGPKEAQRIQENPEENHYVKAFEKLQNGKKFVWNYAAYIFPTWAVYRRISHILSYLILTSFLLTMFITLYESNTTVILNNILLFSFHTIMGGFGDYFLIRHVSKQVNKGDICPFPNGGSLTLAILSGIFPLFILIAILRNKYVISRYRKAKKQES